MKKEQEELSNRIVETLQKLGEEVRGSNSKLDVKVAQMDLLIDTMRFLDRYDENVKVLNDYWLNKQFLER